MVGELKADRYKVERRVGQGGMGVVWRAHDIRLGRAVALKMLPGVVTHNEELRRRLGQEARAASAVSHPCVATVYDFVEKPEESFIVYEFVEGLTLRERLREGNLPVEDVIEIGIRLADALVAAHACGIVHRDLKPENIMIVPGPQRPGHVKILDFGLAKRCPPLVAVTSAETAVEAGSVNTSPGLLVGTVNYMAPEQLEGEPVDQRTDLYALGLVLYEMASGSNPFVGRTSSSTIANILKQEPPPLLERGTVTPHELDRIIRKCLAKRREHRCQSATELLRDLSRVRESPVKVLELGGRDLAAPSWIDSPRRGIGEGLVAPAQRAARADIQESELPVPIPRALARVLLLLIQAGYLAMYGILFGFIPEIQIVHATFAGSRQIGLWLLLAALCGTPIRLYLLSAVGLDYLDLGRKFLRLFPALLLVDLSWAAAPLLLMGKFGGLVILFGGCLAYLPFAQRTLVFLAYSRKGGRSSGIRTSGSG